MARQLSLLETPPSWRLDDATREAGRRGVAEARAQLRAALAREAATDGRSPSRRRRRADVPARRSAA